LHVGAQFSRGGINDLVFLFDADGQLRAYRAGEKAAAPIEEAIERVLKAD